MLVHRHLVSLLGVGHHSATSVAPQTPLRVFHAVIGHLRRIRPFSSTNWLLQTCAGPTARPCSVCVKERYLKVSASPDEQSWKGAFGKQPEDGVFEKDIRGDMKEAGLALTLDADQGIVGVERSDGRA